MCFSRYAIQGCSVCLALVRLPQAVEFEAHILQAQIAPQCTGQQNQLCVNLAPGKPSASAITDCP